MKNKFFYFVLIAVLSCGIFMFTGCATTAPPGSVAALRLAHESWGAFAGIAIPDKDFEPVGLVFTTTTFRVDSVSGITGNAFSYQDLLREAQALGAHGIINVTIDRQSRYIQQQGRQGQPQGQRRTIKEITIRASALAIRYTTTITNPAVQTNQPRTQRVVGGGEVVTETPPAAGTAVQPRTGLLR